MAPGTLELVQTPAGRQTTPVRAPKTEDSSRTVPLPDFCLNALKEHAERQADERDGAGDKWRDHGLVFPTILVVNSQLCGEAEFEACQVACSPPVQRGAGPVGVQPEQVERAGHVHVVEAGFRQAAVAGAARAVAGGLV